MAGYGGRISYEGDVDEATALVGVAIKHANKLQAWKQTQGLANAVRSFDLGNGHYCVVAELEHMRAIHIVSPKSDSINTYFPEWSRSDENFNGVADVISGYVKTATITPENVTLTGPDGTPKVVSLPHLSKFVPTSKTAGRFTDEFRRRRLAVEEDPIFAPVSNESGVTFSEHAHVKPSCYSGAMRKVVQLLLGIGKVLRPTFEEKWMKENNKPFLEKAVVKNKDNPVAEVVSAFQLYEPNVAEPTAIKLKFDYRFNKTHGIAFSGAGTPWVIEIGNRGVHAMRLYLDPVSTTDAGKKRYCEVSPELADFFDEFGGIPIGFAPPTGKKFDELKRAGEIVELISEEDMKEFYRHILYCSEHGWCFNSKGSEAHNTCYSYNEQGIGVGYHYAISIDVHDEVLPEWTDKTRALAALFTSEWQQRKARRMTNTQAKDVLYAFSSGADAGNKAFDAVKVTVSLGTAELSMVRKGMLWHPGRPKGQPQIKFPEPMIGGLASHDFGRLDGYPYPSGIKCNTPMFVSFCDDTLEVVSYFYDQRKPKTPENFNTRENCQIAGSWASGTYAGDSYIAGNFYSNRWDWRETITPEETKTTYNIEKVGSYNYASAIHFFSTCITVTTFTIFLVTAKSRSARGKYLAVSVAFPQNDRTGIYMTKMWGASSVSAWESGFTESVQGPYIHYYELYNFVWHWWGSCAMPEHNYRCIAKKVGESELPSCVEGPAPANLYYACCPENVYSNTVITLVSPVGPTVLGSISWPEYTSPSPWQKTTRIASPEYECEVWMINDSGHGAQLVKKDKVVGGDRYDLALSNWWWMFSPDPDGGGVTSLYSVNSCLGSNVMNYMDDMDGNTKHMGGPEDMHAGWNQCYTGVIG